MSYNFNVEKTTAELIQWVKDYFEKTASPDTKAVIGISGGKDSLTLLYALHGLKRFYPKKFDIIYVDPPYQGGLYDDILGVVKDRNLLREDGFIVLEHPKSLNINFLGVIF